MINISIMIMLFHGGVNLKKIALILKVIRIQTLV